MNRISDSKIETDVEHGYNMYIQYKERDKSLRKNKIHNTNTIRNKLREQIS